MIYVHSHDPPLRSIRLHGHFEEVLMVANRIKYLSLQHLTGEKWLETDDDDQIGVVLWLSTEHQLTKATVTRILEEEGAGTIVIKYKYHGGQHAGKVN